MTPTPDREREAARICEAALDRTTLEREAFVVNECAGDEALRREVESLLRRLSKADAFLQKPALEVAAERMAVPPTLVVGQQIGSYRIEGLLGAGGMGEVHRARDTRLGRDVAIKVLPRIFMSDPGRVARFDREARLLAAVNHPNIGAIYGLESVDGVPALILELVQGGTLESRLTKGPLPIPDALRIADQIAGALEAAHERGIVHRDLKPANVNVTPGGAVKVLDFGLARAVLGDASDPDSSGSPMRTGGTKDGVILGTVAYMSPEQARGRSVDKRADIWAFGCVLYEMLTGQPAFSGDTLSDTMASILQSEPDWRALPDSTPASIQRLLRRCLEKDVSRRLRDTGDARLDIDEALETPAHAQLDRPRSTTRTWPVRVLWTFVGAGVMAIIGALALSYLRGPRGGEEGTVRFTLVPPAETVLPSNPSFALSPDGRRLTFAAVRAGTRQLWVRALDSLEAQPLPGTEDARNPIWSPDGRTVAFLAADGKLKAVELGGGSPRTLCDVPLAGPPLLGESWSPDGGTIVFGQRQAGLFSVPAAGGAPTPLPGRAEPGEARQFQTFLPDGKHFVYLSEPSNVSWLGSFDSSEPPVRLMSAASDVKYVAPGYLVFLRRGRLMAQRFDARRANVADAPVLIADGVSSFTASLSGALVYLDDPLAVTTQLTWADRTGHRLGVVGPPGRYRNPEVSPDGTGAVMEVVGSRSSAPDIVYLEFERGIVTRLTTDPANDDFPTWAPGGREIIFSSDRTGASQLYRIRIDGTGEERVPQSRTAMHPYDWTSDGLLVFASLPSYKLGVLPLTAGGVPREFDPSQPLSSGSGQVSPNNLWIAYNSPQLEPETPDRRRLWNVWVQSFPTPGHGKVRMSADGGASPRWSHDGRELFFCAGDGRLMAVTVTSDGTAVKPGTATALFEPHLLNGCIPRMPLRQQYDVTRDGRFLLNVPVEHVGDQSFTVVVNWGGGSTR